MCFDQEKTQAPMDRDPIIDKRFAERERQLQRGIPLNKAPMPGGYTTEGMAGRAYSDAEIVAELFKYHAPTPEQLPLYAAINQAAKNFAEVILSTCPRGADRSAAIRLLRDARMTANAAIALDGLSL